MGLDDLEGRRLKKSEVTELLSDSKWSEDQVLTQFFGEAKTYVHPERNSVLSVDWNGRGGMLFLDKDAVYRLVRDPHTLEPQHVLKGRFVYGEDFPERARKLSERFAREISLEKSPAITAYSIESLSRIDQYLEIHRSEDLLGPELFGPLVAYIGETIRKNYSMKWRMVHVNENLWEPWLVDDTGNEYPIFAVLYKELYEYQARRSSVRGAVIGEIQKHKLIEK